MSEFKFKVGDKVRLINVEGTGIAGKYEGKKAVVYRCNKTDGENLFIYWIRMKDGMTFYARESDLEFRKKKSEPEEKPEEKKPFEGEFWLVPNNFPSLLKGWIYNEEVAGKENLIRVRVAEILPEPAEPYTFKAGDRVRIVRRPSEKELSDWNNMWTDEMDNRIGKTATIKSIFAQGGIDSVTLKEFNYGWPVLALEPVSE